MFTTNISTGIPSYPSVNDPSIRYKLMRKKEFNDVYRLIEKEDASVASQAGYKNAYRQYITTFLSYPTPYDRMLIIHGVGTGKTRCAIDICENLKKVYNKAVVLNKGDTSTASFKHQLTTYFASIHTSSAMSYYTFNTYKKFSRHIQSLSSMRRAMDYNKCIFIIDEVHNIVTAEHDEHDSVYSTLLNLFDSLSDCVVVGMTATPMRDTYVEIFPLVNMFVAPTKRIAPYPTNPSKFSLCEDQFKQLVRGCVSYYESEFSFDVNYCGSACLGMQRAVVTLYMGDIQSYLYSMDAADRSRLSVAHNAVDLFAYKEQTYISLCTFPLHNYRQAVVKVSEQASVYTKTGTVKTVTHVGFVISSSMTQELKSNIHRYSCKFAYMLDIIMHTTQYYYRHWYSSEDCANILTNMSVADGLVYIFCEDVKETGISTLIALFKLFGFAYYTAGSIHHMSEDSRFTVYVGDKHICSNGIERLEMFRDPRNSTGRYCKIIIASNIMKESVSLSSVKTVFIVTPHWNYSSTDQAEGRSVRRNAFDRLVSQQKHTINIHRLVAITSPQGEKELTLIHPTYCHQVSTSPELESALVRTSIDMYKYHRAAVKQIDIDNIMSILKTESLDYYYNTNRSSFPTYDKLDMTTYSSEKSELASTVLHILTTSTLPIDGWIPVSYLLDTIRAQYAVTREQEDITTLAIDSLNHIVRHSVPIYDSQSNALFLKYQSEYIYTTVDPRTTLPSCDFSFVDLAYRTDKMSTYVNKRVYKIDTDALIYLNSLNRSDFIDIVASEYTLYKLSILEQALAKPEEYSNIISYLEYNVYICYTPMLQQFLYYHTLDTKRERTTAYSCTTKKVKDDDKVHVCVDGVVRLVSSDMLPEALRRINAIRKGRDMSMMLTYGVYGSVSLIDNARRIHDNYVADLLDDDKTRYIDICTTVISAAMNTTDEYTTKMYNDHMDSLVSVQKQLVIPSREVSDNPLDNRCQKRGRLIHTIQKVDKAMCIHKLITRVVPSCDVDALLRGILYVEISQSMLSVLGRASPVTYYDLTDADIELIASTITAKELHCYNDAYKLYNISYRGLSSLLHSCDKRLLLACGAYDANTVDILLWDIILAYDCYIMT